MLAEEEEFEDEVDGDEYFLEELPDEFASFFALVTLALKASSPFRASSKAAEVDEEEDLLLLFDDDEELEEDLLLRSLSLEDEEEEELPFEDFL